MTIVLFVLAILAALYAALLDSGHDLPGVAFQVLCIAVALLAGAFLWPLIREKAG